MSAWMRFRLYLYGRGVLSVTDPVLPLISIGNNSLGGTNKTPMAEFVVRMFMDAGIEAGVVSRGYRTKGSAPLWVGQDNLSLTREIAGDEPLMLAKRLPNVKVVVSKDRIRGVELLAQLGVKVAVTDDTFQHRRMARDVDIVLVDSTCPFGNGKVIPSGFMREPMSAFARADVVVLTKANQVSKDEISKIKESLRPYIDFENLFTAAMKLDSWLVMEGDEERELLPEQVKLDGCYLAFSAIGNAPGFYSFLKDMGIDITACRTYRDHHIFTHEDAESLEKEAILLGACGFICTEKDIANLPDSLTVKLPIYVPRISVSVDDMPRFRNKIYEKLKPRFLVASNGYGEDAIGVVLANKMKDRFKQADIDAFAFVGSGKHYSMKDISVLSPVSEMPSGGVVKYSISALALDIRHGLGRTIREQLKVLRKIQRCYRTPICVGDVYLVMSMLFGYGVKPVLVATAKSVHLSGHLRIEELLLKHRARIVWTRDEETKDALSCSGVNARFSGNPVMDIIDGIVCDKSLWNSRGAHVLLLPGSRPRAYDDIRLILDSAVILSHKIDSCFVMVPAPTIDMRKIESSISGWRFSENDLELVSDCGVRIRICGDSLASAARGADILIGLGGTANQVCAGLGLPVVSIIEKGKLRQKKLLKEAEILVEASSEKLAEAAFKILSSPDLMKSMSQAGKRYLGGTGALDDVVEYCAKDLGFENRCFVYEKYGRYMTSLSCPEK